jgi:hypothetical protein
MIPTVAVVIIRGIVVRLTIACSLAVLCVLVATGVALAAPAPGTAWKTTLVAQPTDFEPLAHDITGTSVDRYVLLLTNTGSAASSSPITVTDTLPAGVAVGTELANGNPGWECPYVEEGSVVVKCVYMAAVAPLGQSTVLTIPVTVSASGVLTDSAVVSGGGAPVTSVSRSSEVAPRLSLPPFEFVDFSNQLSDVSGAPDTQAGDHPYALTTAFDFPQREIEEQPGSPEKTVQIPKDLEMDLPTGLVADPQAVSQCAIVALFAGTCPTSSRVGTIFVNLSQSLFYNEGNNAYPIFNIVPERGYPAEFGVYIEGIRKYAFFYGSVGPPPDYRLHVSVPDVTIAGEVANTVVTFFGNPQGMDNPKGTGGEANSQVAFFTNSSDCSSAPQVTNVTAYTWEEPSVPVNAEAQTPPVAGCDLLRFEPSISLTPETTLADEPSGYSFDARFPQGSASPEGFAAPPLKNTTVVLPQGLSLNPAAADGLAACPAEGPEGIDLSSSAVTGHCPLASQVGTVEAVTPLLPESLQGHVYLATPSCGGQSQRPCEEADAVDGGLYGLYLQVEGSGVVIKLHGTVSANPATGQLTASFRELPQQPVSDLKVLFKGGPRSPLANPQSCGAALTTADMTPWSSPETPDATPSFAFQVTGCGGAPSFAPSFTAGTTGTSAGAYTDFSTTFSRADRTQELGKIQVQTPPGLLGMLSHVTLCGEPQAAAGTCSSASEIGTATAGAGAGSHPFWVSGPVYLTGPYSGAPYGLSVVLPAVAGPFNLGKVVVRATVNVNPTTAALTITSAPLPQILDGVPLRVQTVNVTVNRPEFMFNPTNCTAQQITATVGSARGETAQVASPFAAGGCRNLPFNPGFTVITRKPASKADGAELDVRVSSTTGQANIHSVSVALPKQLPARLKTIQQACLDTTFDADPAACPPVSLIGVAKAVSPVLPVALVGPAYLVSHGGAAFPDVDLVLQGEGVRLDLTGSINISRQGITSSTFASIPDAPISSFELQLPEGPHSALAVTGSLCAKPLTMPTTIVGQNGKRLVRTTKVAVTSCPKKKKPIAKRRAKAGSASRSERFHVTSVGGGR